ncbi:MAG: hypothetical protein U0325_18860 [Polyangiales bacterium]
MTMQAEIGTSAGNRPAKSVFTIIERPNGKNYWARIGAGWLNRDGSISIRLDALPVNGTLQVRDPDERDLRGAP